MLYLLFYHQTICKGQAKVLKTIKEGYNLHNNMLSFFLSIIKYVVLTVTLCGVFCSAIKAQVAENIKSKEDETS